MLVKGAPLTLASPLSRGQMDFLAEFSDSCEELVLSERNLSDDKRAAISTPNDKRKRLELQRMWANHLGVTKATRRAHWWPIVGGVSPKGTYGMSPPRDWPATPPAWDHPSIWARNGRPIIAVSQPYPWLLTKQVEHLNEFASEYGFRFKVSNYPSWHYPGRCWFVEWKRQRRLRPYATVVQI